MTKADLINLEFGERNLRKNQLQISHFLSDELDENSGQQPQSVPLFLSNKFWCYFFIMLSLIIGGKLSRCILANCAFINRRLAPTVSTICTTTQQHNWQTTKLASSGIAISNMDGNIIFNSDQHSDSNTSWNEGKVWFLHVFVLIHIFRDTGEGGWQPTIQRSN